jgi:hypothetical protein
VRTSFTNGDQVEVTEPYRGMDSGLLARVVSVNAGSGMVTVAPPTDEPRSVFLSVDPSSLRHLRS